MNNGPYTVRSNTAALFVCLLNGNKVGQTKKQEMVTIKAVNLAEQQVTSSVKKSHPGNEMADKILSGQIYSAAFALKLFTCWASIVTGIPNALLTGQFSFASSAYCGKFFALSFGTFAFTSR